MLVERNDTMRKLLKQMFREFNVGEHRMFKSGKEALGQFNLYDPDLAIISWLSEDIDGLDTIRMIRRGQASHNPYIPIIIMSGLTSLDSIVEARDAGIHEFLAKPVSPRTLYEKICHVIEHPRQFIRVGEAYFGPDRRRHHQAYIGRVDRRKEKQADAKQAETIPV